MSRSEDSQQSPWHDAADDPRAAYEHHPVEDMEPTADTDLAELGRLLAGLLSWATERPINHRKRRWHVTVGVRTLILIYSIRPDLLEFRNHQQLARDCGLTDRQVENLRAEIRSVIARSRVAFRQRSIDDGVPQFSNLVAGEAGSEDGRGP